MFWQELSEFEPGNLRPHGYQESYCIAFVGDRLVMSTEAPHWQPLDQGQCRWLNLDRDSEHYIGTFRGHPCFTAEATEPLPSGFVLTDLRALLSLANGDLFAAASRAWQMVQWHRTHRYCGRCASPMQDHATDRAKECPNCRLLNYPRLSPCIIVLVTRGEELLLGRSPQFPPGMFSTLAGFIEPGESAEQALYREVLEEVGVQVTNPRYLSSQAWPFPNNLMLGFHADYLAGEVKADGVEVVEAGWFHYKNLPKVPGSVSISGWLIESYLRQLQQ